MRLILPAEDVGERLAVIKRCSTFDLLHVFIAQVESQGLDIRLEMLNLTAADHRKDVWSLL